MNVTTAWAVLPEGGDAPWLISAFDGVTEMEHNGTPQFHLDTIAKSEGDGYVVRTLVLDVDDEAITALFTIPILKVPVVAPGGES